MSEARYALYYAPAVGSAWWRFGAGWLGRDELLDAPLPQPQLPGLAADTLARLTAEPRRYGFHATLVAPFRLRRGVTEDAVLRRADAVAGMLRPVPLPDLAPGLLSDFVALRPAVRNPPLDALATKCVLELDGLRAPLTDDELARRAPQRLDDMGRRLLARYGYPYVLGRFRFHMTLSGTVDAAMADRLVRAAEPLVRQLHETEPLRVDRLCVFRELAPGAPFVRIHEAGIAP